MKMKLIAAAGAVLLSGILSAQIAVKNGDKVAFLGDSITANGNMYPGGYVNLVISGLKANGIDAVKIPAGIHGHMSSHMLERLDRDVLKKKPQIMLLSCGVNDVWKGSRGIPLEQYKKNVTAIVDKAQAQGVKVCLMTATVIREDPKSDFNRNMIPYNQFLFALAKEKKCLIADTNAAVQKGIAEYKAKYPKWSYTLTVDGVHMNSIGNLYMARAVLRALGLNDGQLAKAEAQWKNARSQIGTVLLSAGETEAVMAKAAEKKMSIAEYVESLVARDLSGK